MKINLPIKILLVIVWAYLLAKGLYIYGYKQGALNTRRVLTIEQSDTTIKTCQDDK